jgi:hypothetical protein
VALACATLLLGAAQAPRRPVLSLETDVFDCGRVKEGEVASHAFKVTNRGNALLTLRGIRPGCGCTAATVGRSRLEPGESTEVLVEFSTKHFRGANRKGVDLLTDDPRVPRKRLTLDAFVWAPLAPDQDTVLFGDLKPEDRRKVSVRVASATGETIHVEDVDLSEAPWLGVATREEGKELFVDMDFSAHLLPKDRTSGIDTVTVRAPAPEASTFSIKVLWDKFLPVEAQPRQVAWSGPAGESRLATVTLQSRAGKPFRILSARATQPWIHVEGIRKAPRAKQVLSLRQDPCTRTGLSTEWVYVELDSPGRPELPIRIIADFKP